MKSKLIYTIGLLIILAIPVMAEPKMNIPMGVLDFGYAPQKSMVTCRFWIYSAGTDTLKITDVKPGCGCTKAPLEKKLIAPGDSTFVDITFNTGQYKGRTSKTINITAADSVKAQKVTIIANVITSYDSVKVLTIEPSILDFGGTSDTREITFDIQNRSPEDISPRLVTSPGNDLEITLPEKIKTGESAKAKLRLISKTIPPGYAKSFTFAIDESLQTRFTIPVKGDAALSSTPPQKR